MKLNLILLATSLPLANAFVTPTTESQKKAATLRMIREPHESSRKTTTTTIHRLQPQRPTTTSKTEPVDEDSLSLTSIKKWVGAASLGAALLLATPSTFSTTMAYDPTDYASETVQSTIKALKETAGNAEETYKVYEDMNSIITEGKGVGGAINYKGIQLERGYVADEDTTIYNPGLTLLTESEKERLVEAIVGNRKVALQQQQGDWPETNQLAFEFLRQKLDPFHVAELRGYLQILPLYAAAVYLAVLAVQQFVRELFPVAYIIGVVAVFAPALFLVALGPQ